MLAVIIPVYNNGDLLEKALTSLTIQTNKKFLTIVVDDCSTEDLSFIINKFKDKLFLSYHKLKENKGPGGARQYGLNLLYEQNKKTDAKFEYVTFLDSDDLLYPRATEMLYKEAIKQDVDILVSNITADEKGTNGYVIFPEQNVTWLHGKVYRVDYLKDNNIYFPERIYNEDSFFNQLAFAWTSNIYKLDETFYFWRANQNSLTRKDKFNFRQEHNIEYITSQTKVLEKILKQIKEKPVKYEKILAILIYIYRFSQLEKYVYMKNIELLQKTYSELGKLITNYNLREKFKGSKFSNIYETFLKSGELVGKDFFFYPQTFPVWLNEVEEF